MSVCKFCGSLGHTAFVCLRRPKKRFVITKPIKRVGKVGRQWQSAKELWGKRNTSDVFDCFYCKKPLERSEVTLDHYLSRGRHPELRNELSNIVVACWSCNAAKGSLNGDEYLEKRKRG